MPCYSLISTNVVFGGNTDSKIVHAALEDMGLRPVLTGSFINFSTGSYNRKTHEFKFNGSLGQQHAQEIKRAYSDAVIRSQAARFGWSLKAGKEKYSYVVQKRSI